jgi:hypothetical protein
MPTINVRLTTHNLNGNQEFCMTLEVTRRGCRLEYTLQYCPDFGHVQRLWATNREIGVRWPKSTLADKLYAFCVKHDKDMERLVRAWSVKPSVKPVWLPLQTRIKSLASRAINPTT